MPERNILAIGGSAGAAESVTHLLKELPGRFPASIFISLHLSPTGPEWLSSRFARTTGLRVTSPQDEEPIEMGRVYVAAPDRHLIIKEGRVQSGRGPRENLWRPAIDVTFRTAAVAYGHRVVGVLMSGELDDGTAGLQAIKSCGGVTVVQNPTDSMYPAMLRTALANVEIDHCVRLNEMPALLARLVAEPAGAAVPISDHLRAEALMAEAPQKAPHTMQAQGAPGVLSCPECSGPLWQYDVGGAQFRCLVGHSFRLDSLADGAEQEIDRTLWAAIRLFEQRVNIARMMGEQERSQGRTKRAELYESRAAESQRHAQALRELHRARRTLPQTDSEPH